MTVASKRTFRPSYGECVFLFLKNNLDTRRLESAHLTEKNEDLRS